MVERTKVNEYYENPQQFIDEIKSIMDSNGAIGTLMSGSGPSVFGIFNSRKCQEDAFSALKNKGISAFLCKTI